MFTHGLSYVKSYRMLGILFFASLSTGLYADESVPKDIFLRRGETLDREVVGSKLAKHMSPCMSLTSNKSLPSGYVRLFVSAPNERTEIR